MKRKLMYWPFEEMSWHHFFHQKDTALNQCEQNIVYRRRLRLEICFAKIFNYLVDLVLTPRLRCMPELISNFASSKRIHRDCVQLTISMDESHALGKMSLHYVFRGHVKRMDLYYSHFSPLDGIIDFHHIFDSKISEK